MVRAPYPLHLAPIPPALPRWLRQAVGRDDIETVMFSTGAALAALDPVVRSDDPVGFLWRKRLALSGAVAVSQLEGRREDAARLACLGRGAVGQAGARSVTRRSGLRVERWMTKSEPPG